ncbi:MAG: hypothetical protein IT479_02440 [Xanthomonadales bacterium]|nr:hypothetical protein [Xanthomonadales bacterium]MCC6592107.1 hypothetical protein [Xanthomonadales bacterium]MCE7932321.1 hypothetical protein [Xanthomonadales bacterium PRO6]
MKRQPTAAVAVARLQNRPLPLDTPRDAWPGLIERAAAALEGRRIYDSETLAVELRSIASAMRAGGVQ